MAKKKTPKGSGSAHITDRFSYGGVDCQVGVQNQQEELTVGDTKVHCSRDAETGAYIPDDSPYERHGSLQELAKAHIDRAQGNG